MTKNERTYLGDWVYIREDDHGIILETGEDAEATNVIRLHVPLLNTLTTYLTTYLDLRQAKLRAEARAWAEGATDG